MEKDKVIEMPNRFMYLLFGPPIVFLAYGMYELETSRHYLLVHMVTFYGSCITSFWRSDWRLSYRFLLPIIGFVSPGLITPFFDIMLYFSVGKVFTIDFIPFLSHLIVLALHYYFFFIERGRVVVNLDS